MNLLHTIHVPPGSGPFPTVIALHGWGASAHDLLGLAPLFPEKTLTLCPQGRVEVPIGNGANGYGWFPLVPGQPPEPRDFLKASVGLREFVDQAVDTYPIDRNKILVLGFSQGGVMGFDLALRHPARFGGLAALSTWLPEPIAAQWPDTGGRKGFPVLLIHGSNDPLIEIAKAHQTRSTLETFEVDLSYHEFAMAHEIRPQALQVIRSWLEERLGGN